MAKEPKKVILDVDTGIDDAVAITLAVRSPEVNVIGITTVAGNATVNNTTRNTLRMLEFLGKTGIPVAKGMSRPILGELKVAEMVHGKDGLGDVDLPDPKIKPINQHAMDFLIDKVYSYRKGEVNIVATGPLTNIAMAFLKDPDLPGKIGQIVSMGGAFGVTVYGYGNDTPVAEFNIYTDPVAAKIVYNSGVNLTSFGLDVTMTPEAGFTREMYNNLARINTKTANLFHEMFRGLIEFSDPIAMHDPMAVSYLIDSSIFKVEKYHVDVEIFGELTRGQTVADRRFWFKETVEKFLKKPLPEELKNTLRNMVKEPNVNVCVDLDSKKFLDLLLKRTIYEKV